MHPAYAINYSSAPQKGKMQSTTFSIIYGSPDQVSSAFKTGGSHCEYQSEQIESVCGNDCDLLEGRMILACFISDIEFCDCEIFPCCLI